MSDTPLGLFLVIFAVFTVVRYRYTLEGHRRKIRNFLKERKAKNITVFLTPPWVKGSVYFYEVTYDDETGRPYMEKYKIYSWDSSIHRVDED